jgi:predicted GNAT family acetyltransferase
MNDRTAGGEAVRISDNPEERRYEAWLGDRLAGKAEYRIAGERVIFFHTEIDPAFEGHGVGSRLAREALDDVRARGLRVTPKCPFIAAWIARHPAYQDLVADRSRGQTTA